MSKPLPQKFRLTVVLEGEPMYSLIERTDRREKEEDKVVKKLVTNKPITGDMVFMAIERARAYVSNKVEDEHCLNVDGKGGSCNCIFQLNNLKSQSRGVVNPGDSLRYRLVCEEMSKWFEDIRQEEMATDMEGKGWNDVKKKIADRVWIISRNNGRANTKMVDLSWDGVMKQEYRMKPMKQGWEIYDWEVTNGEEFQHSSYATMCVPTTILVWRMLVCGDSWTFKKDPIVKSWLARKYQKILLLGGKNEEQNKKQKLHQRLFYGRMEDYMALDSSAKQVSFQNCLETFRVNGWAIDEAGEIRTDQHTRERMRHNWVNWRLHKFHILCGESSHAHNKRTQELVQKLNIKVTRLKEEQVDFLELLFTMVGENQRSILSKVSVDRKLLFLPFTHCTNVENALHTYFSNNRGNQPGPKLREFMSKKSTTALLQKADGNILGCFRSMLGNNTLDVAYQISLLFSKVHFPQEPHIDYDIATDGPQKYMVAFLPLTTTGQFLQVWEPADKCQNEPRKGELIFIPRGQLVLVPGNTIHGGGFRAEHRTDNQLAHMRLHFYVYPGATECMVHRHKNSYVKNPHATRYIHHPELREIATALGTTFFEGKLEEE